jgi:hypothetical protein
MVSVSNDGNLMRRARLLALLLLTAAAPPQVVGVVRVGVVRVGVAHVGAAHLPVPPMPPRRLPAALLPVPPIPPRPTLRRTALVRPLPREPAAPLLPALEPAPVPDRDKYPPPRVRLPVEASAALFWPMPDMQGDGFVPGSAHQIEIERPGAGVPGVKFTVPIQ